MRAGTAPEICTPDAIVTHVMGTPARHGPADYSPERNYRAIEARLFGS
jgi:hypothetical protein